MIDRNLERTVKVVLGVDDDQNTAYIELYCFWSNKRKVRVYNQIPTKQLYQDLVNMFTGRP
jgi:hypothetical protein